MLRWDTWLVGFEILVTVLLGFLPESAPFQISQVAINFICSMQYNTFRQAEGVPMSTTFCTNNLRQVGIHMVKWVKKGSAASLQRSLRYGGSLVMFALGAALGAVLCRFFAGRAIWGSSLLLLIVFADLMYADRTREKGKLEQVPRGH